MSGEDPGRPRRKRLSRSGDFKRAYREGDSRANRFLVVYRFDRADDPDSGEGSTRLGISVSRKVGNAVTRNRVKRILGEGFWEVLAGDASEADFVLVARPGIEQMIETDGMDGVKSAISDLILAEPSEGEDDGSGAGSEGRST